MTQPMPVAEQRRAELSTVRQQLDSMLGEFARVLPSHITAKQFARVTLTAIQNNRELLECDRLSLWKACMRAAEDGLLPDGRHGAIVPYKDRKRGIKVAQWLAMIAGIRQKIRNSGEVATLDVEVVRERDQFEYERGDNPHILHRPVRGPRGAVVAAYSIAKLKSGEISREWMWVEEIEEIRKASPQADGVPWTKHYGEMCKKTVAKRHSKVLPMSTDVLGIINRDDEPFAARPAPDVAPAPPEPRALTDALNLLAASGDDPADERAPFDGETGEVIDQPPESASDELIGKVDTVVAEAQTEAPAQATPAEPQHVDQAAERVRYLATLTDAATAGLLDETYRRFPKRWQRELERLVVGLKFREGGG